MAQTLKIPGFAEALATALKDGFPDAQVDMERIGRTNRYRFAVISPRFQRMDHPKRQNLVWDIAERVLKPQELLRVGLILTLRPDDLMNGTVMP